MVNEICIFIAVFCFGFLIAYISDTEKRVKAKLKECVLREIKNRKDCFETAVKMNKIYVKMQFERAKTPEEFCDNIWAWLNNK